MGARCKRCSAAGDGGFDLLGMLALLTGRPIQPAQAIQNFSFDPVFGIGLQVHMARWVEMVDGRNKAHDTGGHQIVQADISGQAAVNPAGDHAYLGQMLQDQALALFGREVLGLLGELDGLGDGIHVMAPATDKGNRAPKIFHQISERAQVL